MPRNGFALVDHDCPERIDHAVDGGKPRMQSAKAPTPGKHNALRLRDNIGIARDDDLVTGRVLRGRTRQCFLRRARLPEP